MNTDITFLYTDFFSRVVVSGRRRSSGCGMVENMNCFPPFPQTPRCFFLGVTFSWNNYLI